MRQFLPGPPEDELDLLPPLPRAEPNERAVVAQWEQAQGAQALHLAQVAARFGALDDRMRRGPDGWRHRLALIEASTFSWLTADRVSVDRLGLWHAMRISAAGEDTTALQKASWAFRRLADGPGPGPDLAGFLGRHEVEGEDPLTDKIAAWTAIMAEATALHPIGRACLAFHLWPMTGIGAGGDLLEGAVIAAVALPLNPRQSSQWGRNWRLWKGQGRRTRPSALRPRAGLRSCVHSFKHILLAQTV